MTIKAIITTLDNLPLLQEQIPLLKADPLIDGIVVVNNGSQDGTAEWLEAQQDITYINRENKGAGPGRNAGIDAALPFDYALFLDGGIRPLIGGTERMLDYLDRHPEVDVIGVEIPDFETDYDRAWRRWPKCIDDPAPGLPNRAYENKRLSLTAYCLTRYRAWDGLRFCEEGPFGQPGWGADDDEMAAQWRNAGIVVHAVTGIHPYRRASGSFTRLFRETGVWPNQYGSVYEQRVVWLQHHWSQYGQGVLWDRPWLTVIVKAGELDNTIHIIKSAHDMLRQRRFGGKWSHVWNPYGIVLWLGKKNEEIRAWAEPRRYRQHHGDAIVLDSKIIRRTKDNESTWTGDFVIWEGDTLPTAPYLYAVVSNLNELAEAVKKYNVVYPSQTENIPPTARGPLTTE